MSSRLQFLKRSGVLSSSLTVGSISIAFLLTIANCEIMAQATKSSGSTRLISDQMDFYHLVIDQVRAGVLRLALEMLSPLGERATTLSIQGRDASSEVCGALFKSISQLSSTEQYNLRFAWTFPSDGPVEWNTAEQKP